MFDGRFAARLPAVARRLELAALSVAFELADARCAAFKLAVALAGAAFESLNPGPSPNRMLLKSATRFRPLRLAVAYGIN